MSSAAKGLLEIKQSNIGVFLGSFDPIHTAHIDIPCQIRDHYQLDKIIFVPTNKSPIGRKFFADYNDRVTMIRNAIKGYEFFAVSTFEKLSEKTSYSIDTINYFIKKYNSSSLRLIIGEDNFHNFTLWYKYLDILSLVNIIVLCRENDGSCVKINELDNLVEKNINLFNQTKSGKIHFSNQHKSQISGTILRDMIKRNESIQNIVSKVNYEFIKKNGLYK